jgi:hypothetical protein
MRFISANRSVVRFLSIAILGLGLLSGARLILDGKAIPGPAVPPPAAADSIYLTHISTDKPIYRIGEKVYVRAVLLGATGHAPGATGAINFEVKGPKGDRVTSGASTITDSIAGFSWDIPASLGGGEYTIRVSRPSSSDAPAERNFEIRAYRPPRLKSQIVFVRDGYGPGDTVSASLHVDRAEGGVPEGAKVSVLARVDGREIWKGQTAVDRAGNATASFKLPDVIARGEGSIAMIIEDGGIVETAAKTIPILLQTLDLAIYPEGGDLVAGLPNRVYLEGRTPAQKPADIAGVIRDNVGRQVATFRTEHEGRGRFSFVPSKGGAYFLHVTEPSGIKTIFPLPEVKDSGAVIASISDVTPHRKDVVVHIASTTDGEYGVALTQRGKELSFKSISLKANRVDALAFTLPRALDGVIVATVYDDQKNPLAERLLFRIPEHNLKVQVTADREGYVPGDKVTLRVSTTDVAGKPVGAVIGLTVTDSSVLEMIEKREQTGRLPVMVLLESEVRNLADAHVYLDETNPKAPLATDLLLGTQGWRRFATVDPAKFVADHGDAARRVLSIGVMADAEWRIPGASAAVTGTITDRSGAYIPGVTVRAISLDTGVTSSAFTNEAGAYTFVNQAPGRYSLSASLPGFQMTVLQGLDWKPGTSYRYNMGLEVGAINAMVEVRVEGNALRFEKAAAFADVLQKAAAPANGPARDLPLAGNNVLDLLQILPGVRLAQERAAIGDMLERQRMSVVREYAHARRPGWTEGSRADFAETVYWNAGVRTDADTGIATVSFDLSDAVTSFRVLTDGFTRDGALGAGVSHIESVQPLSIEPKVPLQVTSGDVIQLPIGIINGTSSVLRGTEVTAKPADGLKFTMAGGSTALSARERMRRILRIDVGQEFRGMADLLLDARAGAYRDSVSRKIDVQPLGFPFERSSSGVLEANGSTSFTFTLPNEIVRGSLSSSVTVYPTPLANMTQALQSLLQQPYGCFEQTSSTSYPMVMAQQYFLTHTGVDPAIIEKTRGLLDASYKRLTGFETRTKGYEWFGADPGHEALTAYGLLQFTDMSQVRSVDKEMLDRTRTWLLGRRDGSGGFSLSSKSADSFGRAPVDTTNAYITWALIESGEKGLAKEIAAVKASASSTQDSYIMALGGNVLHAADDPAGARQLMDKLVRNQDASGAVKGAVTSITRSGGDALTIETTALSVLAWMREPAYAANVEKGLRWIVESNKNGRFGSTQSTILALRAIVAYDVAHARPKAPGRLVLLVDGKTVGAPVAFDANTQGAIALPEFSQELGPGRHTLVLRMEDGSNMPFSMSVKYHSTLPDNAEQAQVGIKVVLKDTEVREGGVTEAIVSIANKHGEAIPTPVAIVGIPGGLEVRHDQLKELVKSGKIAAYEVFGREVILYWRYLKDKDSFEIPLSLVAAVPGSYTGPASRAYLYYTDEHKTWAPGLNVNITPR